MEIKKIIDLIMKSIRMFKEEAPEMVYTTHITKSMLDSGVHRSIFLNINDQENMTVEVGEILPPVWHPIFVNLWVEENKIQGKITLPGYVVTIKQCDWNNEDELIKNIIVEEAQFFYSTS